MKRFRRDNTEGYTQDDLDALNEAFERELATHDYEHLDDAARGSFEDHIAEQVQQVYDLYPERHGSAA